MKTELTTILQDLVLHELKPGSEVMEPEQITTWMVKLPEISKNIAHLLRLMVFSPLSNVLVKRHVRQIQRECLFLIDTLEGYQHVAPELQSLYQAALSCLFGILENVKNRYPDYFSLDLPVPASRFKILVGEIEGNMDRLRLCLKHKSKDTALQSLIIESFKGFLSAGNCSYCRFDYIQGLQKSLISLCNEVDSSAIDIRLQEHLVYYNLNNMAHINYHKSQIKAGLSEFPDLEEQYDFLLEYRRMFKGWQQLKGSFYKGNGEGIRAVLLKYLDAELKYRFRQRAYPSLAGQPAIVRNNLQTLSQKDRFAGNEDSGANSSYRIKVLFSVDALAYFFKLLIGAGVVVAEPRSKLMSFIARSFTTPGRGAKLISPHSLDNKYKQVVQATANRVRVVLRRMLKLLDQEFKLA
jgi:hypothetical protein